MIFSALIFILGVCLLLILLAVVLNFVMLLDALLTSDDFSTSKQAAAEICSILTAYGKDAGSLYDLGSCRGDLALRIAKTCRHLRVYGVDKSRLRVAFSRLKAFFRRRPAHFIRANIFQTDVAQADAVYIYQDRSLMKPLEDKLQRELKSGALVIISTYHFPAWSAVQTVVVHPAKPAYEKLFVHIKR